MAQNYEYFKKYTNSKRAFTFEYFFEKADKLYDISTFCVTFA